MISITTSASQTVSNGGTITFTLNFLTAAVLDHFKCYGVQGFSIEEVVPKLEDQFGAVEATVTNPRHFCNPVVKTYDGAATPIFNEDHHLTLYEITGFTTQTWVVKVDNQFGEQELVVSGPVMVALPTKKQYHNLPFGLDHFLLYEVEGPDMQVVVQLMDQWKVETVGVLRPVYFANPAEKTDSHIDPPLPNVIPIQHPEEHLVFYEIVGQSFRTSVNVSDQFGFQTLSVYDPRLLAVPSEKISAEQASPPPLDASIEFETWTINGQPVPPGTYEVTLNTVIDIRYKEHVSGEEDAVVTVHQTNWLSFHYKGQYEGTWLHAVNCPHAVSMSPPADILSQMTSVEGQDAPYCTEIWGRHCEPIKLDVEIVSEQVVCVNYTKTINWLGIPSPGEVLFDVYASEGDTFTLTSMACVELDGDENPDNDCTDWCPELNIVFTLPPP